jgi:hypothetical protein
LCQRKYKNRRRKKGNCAARTSSNYYYCNGETLKRSTSQYGFALKDRLPQLPSDTGGEVHRMIEEASISLREAMRKEEEELTQ